MLTAAVLPVKSYARAKQRLGDAFDAPDRRELAAAMVGDVLEALGEIDALGLLVVVTAEPLAAEAAREAGARVVHDGAEAGQSAAAALGIDAALEHGAGRVLLVPGDCPALDPGEVEELLAGPSGVAIVPDRHGSGTNALVLEPPRAIPPAFGPGSLARHAALARAAGVPVRIAPCTSLGLDVDTAADLAALEAALPSRPGAAPRTRARLAWTSV